MPIPKITVIIPEGVSVQTKRRLTDRESDVHLTVNKSTVVTVVEETPPSPPAPPPPAPPPPPPAPPPTSDIAVLHRIDLGQAGPYVAAVAPIWRGEGGTYNREDSCAAFINRTHDWVWQFGDGQVPASPVQCRMMVDGVAVTGWVASDPKFIKFPGVTLENGHHIIHVETQIPSQCMGLPCVVNDTGAPLPEQKPWTCTMRFERNFGNHKNEAVQFQYGEVTPLARPLKARSTPTFGQWRPLSQLWSRHPVTNTATAICRRWALSPTGDMLIERDQKYFYGSSAIYRNEWRLPSVSMRDGPRGVGTIGFVSHMRRVRNHSGVINQTYGIETNGRLWAMKADGTIVTEAGWRQKGVRVHADAPKLGRTLYQGKPFQKVCEDTYAASWELIGDWSRVTGPKGFFEPWTFAVAEFWDGKLNTRMGHEFWVPDTLHHRILFVNHWTAHSATGYAKASYPPVGYVSPEGPTGQTEIADFLPGTGGPSDMLNEPWGCDIGPDGKFYWCNFGNGTIWRCDMKGTNPELVLRTNLNPTDIQLGLKTGRLSQGMEPTAARSAFLRDGPVGQASCTRPQYLQFDSQGRLLWSERYTYAIRRLDLSTGIVSTVCTTLNTNGGSDASGNNDLALVIDIDGTTGAVDNFLTWDWAGNGLNGWKADGTWLGRLDRGTPLQGGPADLSYSPNYGWGMDVYGGVVVAVGSAGGHQMHELSARQATDPKIDYPMWLRGVTAYAASGLTSIIGAQGQGELGLPNAEQLALLPDNELKAHLLALGVPEISVVDVVYYIRWQAIESEPV